MHSGLLSEPAYNSRYVELINISSLEDAETEIEIRTKSCANKIAITLTADRLILPYPYLNGIPNDLVLGTMATYTSELFHEHSTAIEIVSDLIERGPKGMPQTIKTTIDPNFPIECQYHLKKLMEDVQVG